MIIKCYSELAFLPSFEERYEYLRLGGNVGKETFGFDRYLNQVFYRSREWKSARDAVIIRDCGCDLGVAGNEIRGKIIIHHMNPVTVDMIVQRDAILLNPEYLICTTHATHNAIHYGDKNLLVSTPAERCRNDTCPWKS